jgi:hypothetical protein
MPNKKISELTTVASPLSADYIPLVEDGVTKKATLASLPLSDAEVTALALKAPLASPTFTGTVTIPTLALTNDLAVTEGGTGASTAANARTNLGLSNVDNTSDANKPVSTAQQTALDLKVNLSSLTPWTPVVTSSAGTITSVSATGQYKTTNGVCSFTTEITITTNGTGSGAIDVTLPVAATQFSIVTGRADGASGKQLQGKVTPAGGLTIWDYNNVYPGSDGEVLRLSGEYFID